MTRRRRVPREWPTYARAVPFPCLPSNRRALLAPRPSARLFRYRPVPLKLRLTIAALALLQSRLPCGTVVSTTSVRLDLYSRSRGAILWSIKMTILKRRFILSLFQSVPRCTSSICLGLDKIRKRLTSLHPRAILSTAYPLSAQRTL